MTISIQNTIINALITTLRSITTANNFQTNINKVKRGIRGVKDFEGDLPSLALWKYKNVRDDSFQSGSESLLQMRVWGFVQSEPMQDDYDNLDKLAADVEKILMSSTYNDAYYTNTFIGDTIFYEGGAEMNHSIFEMEFEISYFYKFTEV